METAKTMLLSGRWLYVAFMCQQAVEKLVKGLYLLYVDDDIPRVHAIRQIVILFEEKLPEPIIEKHYELFDKLSAFYIEGRYTDYKRKLSDSLNAREAQAIYDQTREVFAWPLTMKP